MSATTLWPSIRYRLIAAGVCWLVAACADKPMRKDLSAAEQRADLAFLATEFGEREQSFTPQSRAEFENRLAVIQSRVGTMSHNAFVTGVQWIVAAAGNGHTEVLSHEHQRLRLPVDLEWFADGLFVIAARPGHEHSHEQLLGARVESIEGHSPDAVLMALNAYAPGTDEHVRVISGFFVERPELLAEIGLARSAEQLNITFVLADGTLSTRTLSARADASTARASDARRVLDGIDPLPLYLRDPEQSVFTKRLADLNAIYIRVNQNHDKSLPGKLDAVLDAMRTNPPRNAIVDLRLNGGGNYQLSAPFAEALPDLIPDDGRIVLILGNQSFSAAIITAAIIKARAGKRVIIVGDKAGDKLTFWSEGAFLALPNSGLRVHYSDGYHDWEKGFDGQDPRNRANPRMAAVNERYSAAAGSLDPELFIPLRFSDYAAGRDPVMARLPSLIGNTAP